MKDEPYKLRAFYGLFIGAGFGVGLAFGVIRSTTVIDVALCVVITAICFAVLAVVVPRIYRRVIAFIKEVSW